MTRQQRILNYRRVIESHFRYSVGTGDTDGGAVRRCHKRTEESRRESSGPSSWPGWSTRRVILAYLTTAVGSFGKATSPISGESKNTGGDYNHERGPSLLFRNTLSTVIFQASPHPAVTVTQPQGSYPGLTPTPDTDGSIKIERLPVTNASKLTPK